MMLKWFSNKDLEQLDTHSFKPPDDPVYQYLLEEAGKGRIPVYFAAVPLSLIQPYDPEFHPEKTPKGKEVLDSTVAFSQGGKFHYLWIYPRQEHFVMSDDYLTYAAALKLQPDFLQCMVLGHPNMPGVKDAQGPIRTEDIRKLLLGE
jgi:hypothetical protein